MIIALLAGAVSSTTMIGRDGSLLALDDLLTAAAEQRPGLAIVGGDAGVGKTRLVDEVERRAAGHGFRVLHGECVEFGGESLPYAPIIAALREAPDALGLARERLAPETVQQVARLFPGLGPAGAGGGSGRASASVGQGRLFELVFEVLRALAHEETAILVVLEDVHWADRSSCDFLAYFARNVRTERLALIATYRTDALDRRARLRALLAELDRRRSTVQRVDLSPLDRAELARQVEAIMGESVSAAVVDELHARTGGNPFFVEELLAARRAGQAGDVPSRVAEAVLVRIEALPRTVRDLLTLVAASGGPIGFDALERLVPAPRLSESLHAAFDAHVLVRDRGDESVRFRHALMGEVVYDQLLPGDRRALHSRIARALAEQPGAPPAQVAYHWDRAGARPEALAASVAAGLQAAEVYAYAEARQHLERAIELWDEVAPDARVTAVDKVDLLSRAAQAARCTNAAGRAAELCRTALDTIDPTREPLRAAMLYERLGEAHFADDREALRCYERALALLPGDATPERARLLAAEGHALMGLRRWDEARARCEEALELAASPAQEAAARVTLGIVLAFAGESEAGERELRSALALAGTEGAEEDLARAHLHLAELLRVRGDHAGAAAVMGDGEAMAARLGMRGSFGNFMYVNATEDLFRLGRWDEVALRLAESSRMELSFTATLVHHAIAGQLHALRGERELVRMHVERIGQLERGRELPAELAPGPYAVRAMLALLEERPEDARDQVAAALAAVEGRKDPLYTPVLHSLGVRAEADLAERDRARRAEVSTARAEALVADVEALVGGGPDRSFPDGRAHAALARAELSRVAGEPDRAAWSAAAAAWDALDEPYPAAYARLREAEAALQARAARPGAATLLAAARDTARALGAAPLLAEVEALIRRARLDAGPSSAPAPAPEPARGSDLGLTAREVEVLTALADGLTNKAIAEQLFISDKTVNSHLEHIFEKLGVHTRVEAAGVAHRLGLRAQVHAGR